MLIGEHQVEEFILEVFDSIDDLDVELWNTAFADGHPFKTHGFIQACEQVFPHRQYRFLCFRTSRSSLPLGLLFATQEKVDLFANAGGYMQVLLRTLRSRWPLFGRLAVAVLGSYETSGQHWWFSDVIATDRHISLINCALTLAFPRARLRVIRDLVHQDNDSDLNRQLQAFRFHQAASYPLAQIPLHGRSWAEHSLRLKANGRKNLNRRMTQLRQSNWRIVHYREPLQSFELLYELYLNTHRQASEFKREALPIEFFERVLQLCSVVVSVLYDLQDRVYAFIFSGVSDTIINPFVFGRDYRSNSEVNAYYVLHIDLIQRFSSRNTQSIDLGITNYFLKQNFGARLQRNDIYLKLSNPLLNELFGRPLAKQFSIPQPEERNVFKYDYQG